MHAHAGAGVPRVFDRIYAAAMGKIEKGGLAARLFNWGYRTKAAKLAQNVQHDKARAQPPLSKSNPHLASLSTEPFLPVSCLMHVRAAEAAPLALVSMRAVL
jgi:hypothetical protein